MIDAIPTPSTALFWAFVLLPATMAIGFAMVVRVTSGPRAGQWTAVILAIWMGYTAILAATRVLDAWAPPPLLLLLLSMVVFLVWASRRAWLVRLCELSLKWLVGFQAFRIIVEVMIHQAVAEGIAHPTMTWSGTNFDIVAGMSALLLAPFADRVDRRFLQVWNLLMAGVLIITVVTAVLAMPTPFRQIGGDPPNVWLSQFPFVWLPTVLLLYAWLGHVVLFTRLRRTAF